VNKYVIVLPATIFLMDVALSSWYMVLPIYLESLGATLIDIGVCYALINVAWYGLQVPGGFFADRIGRKTTIILSTLAFCVCYMVLSVVSTLLLAILAIIFMWVFSGLQAPSIFSVMAESVVEKERPIAFAIYSFFMNLGWSIGPLVGALIIPFYGYKILFVLGVIISGSCLVIRFLFIQETLKKLSKKKQEISTKINKDLAYLLAGCSLFSLAYGLVSPIIPIHAEKCLMMSISEIEIMFSIAQFATSILSLACGPFVKKVGGQYGLMMAFLGSGFSITMWAYSPSVYIAITLMIFFSIFFYALYDISYGTLISSLTTLETRATTFGTFSLMSGLMSALGSIAGPIIFASLPIATFVLTTTLTVPSTLFVLKIKTN